MARLEIILALAITVLFCGCAGDTGTRKYGDGSSCSSHSSPDPDSIWQLAVHRVVHRPRKTSSHIFWQYRHRRRCGQRRAPCRRFRLFRPINYYSFDGYCDCWQYISDLGGH